ncbi:hypothetical protein [Halorarum halobium]|uniref:hypothetical protein n=1 Tax=Halorarum halobium TaxID=3075121 RepID=UPI0028B0B388|nr:hypothetical protein [Halobaculum sp. XH14]
MAVAASARTSTTTRESGPVYSTAFSTRCSTRSARRSVAQTRASPPSSRTVTVASGECPRTDATPRSTASATGTGERTTSGRAIRPASVTAFSMASALRPMAAFPCEPSSSA